MNLPMKIRKSFFSILLTVLFISSCSINNSYKRANNLYKKDNYVSAINFYDDFLKNNPQGMYSTIAELERSDCYYQLGSLAYEKQNWLLANRLFYLANSEIADELMDNCYFQLADNALQEEDIELAFEHYDYILENFPDSELIPDILINRIYIFSEQNRNEQLLADYKMLFTRYPDRDTDESVRDIVDGIILLKINELSGSLDQTNYMQTLTEMLILLDFPTKHKALISRNIANIYLYIAEIRLEEKEYSAVVNNLLKAKELDASLEQIVEGKLLNTFQYFIDHGNELAKQLKFTEALDVFDQCLQIFPDFEPTIEARKKVENTQLNYQKAAELESSASEQELKKNYEAALELYKSAHSHYQTQDVENKIFIMKNLLRAQKDPQAFAISLIENYKKGKIIASISNLENQLIEVYGKNIVRSSGWKIQYSTGEYQYEVRYDILSSDKNYYFVWLVDLKKGIVSPLNKISEELM